MKKALVCILSLALLLALTACGKVQAEQPAAEPEPPQAQTTTPEPPNTVTPEPVSATVPAAPVESETTQDPAETDTPETAEPEPISEPDETGAFTEVNETVYATGTVNMRSGPGTQYDKLGQLATGDEVLRIGIGITGTEAENWSRVQLQDGSTAYINNNYLSLTKPAPAQQATGGKAATGGGTATGGATGSSKTTKQATTEEEWGMSFAGWEQSPDGTWSKSSRPESERGTSDTPATQPPNHDSPIRDFTPEEHERAVNASARVNRGEQELKYDEEGGFYYYEY